MRLFKSIVFMTVLLTLVLFLFSCRESKPTIKLFFDSNGGSQVVEQNVIVGQAFSLPQQPSKSGYVFDGWYIDNQTFNKEFTSNYDLSKIEDSTLTLYAKWVLSVINTTITFEENGGSNIADITQSAGSSISAPAAPTKEGYTFSGWYSDVTLTTAYTFTTMPTSHVTVYAKWIANNYTITFEENGGSVVIDITQSAGSSISAPTAPTKEGYTFGGWYIDEALTTAYTFTTMPASNQTLYAKWEIISNPNDHLQTDTLPIHSSLYGNTNGNLNNKGLAVYDTKRSLHYYSYGSTVYQYNPALDQVSVLMTLSSGGRATFLNLDNDVLYYVDSNNGFLIAYHLVNKTFITISETENIYASRVQTWINFVYPTILYEQSVVAMKRYWTTTQTISNMIGYGYEHLNVYYTRVYYKPKDTMSLNVMSDSGSGKSTIVNLETLNVTTQYESLLYHVSQDYTAYFALILDRGQDYGLYFYQSNGELTQVMSGSSGSMRGLNYDGTYIYVISGTGLYRIHKETKVVELITTVASTDAYINIINHWIYIGSYDSSALYRINPSTHETENVTTNS